MRKYKSSKFNMPTIWPSHVQLLETKSHNENEEQQLDKPTKLTPNHLNSAQPNSARLNPTLLDSIQINLAQPNSTQINSA